MNIIIRHLLPNFILMATMIYAWYYLLDRKINFKNYKLYIALISSMVASLSAYLLLNKFIRIVLLIFVLTLIFKFLFRENLKKSLTTTIFYQVISLVAETFYALILTLLFKVDAQKFLESNIGILITNLSIAIISIVLIKIKKVSKLYKKMVEITDKIKSIHLIVVCVITMVIENVLIMSSYYSVKFEYLLIFNSVVIIICFSIVLYSLLTQNKLNKVSDKYNIAIKSLNDYEDMMTKYRINNHENKNLLLTVRAMIVNKDKDIPKYIDTIIEDKYLDDEKLLLKVNSIPSGGLRATIYSEILKIKDNKINYNLNIARQIKTVDLIELDTSTVVDICKIIGVLIDNAIEEVNRLKEKEIDIDLYLENKNLCIKVANNYKNKINVDKINDEGYTTKGAGHGYGLALVKKIISENKNIESKTEISKNVFSQVIYIKNKKTH